MGRGVVTTISSQFWKPIRFIDFRNRPEYLLRALFKRSNLHEPLRPRKLAQVSAKLLRTIVFRYGVVEITAVQVSRLLHYANFPFLPTIGPRIHINQIRSFGLENEEESGGERKNL